MRHKAMKNWNIVYSFTRKQYMGNKRYWALTIGLSVLILLLFFGVMLLSAAMQEDSEEEESEFITIERLCFLNETDYSLDELEQSYEQIKQLAATGQLLPVGGEAVTEFAELELCEGMSLEALIAHAGSLSDETCAVRLYRDEDGALCLQGIVPFEGIFDEESFSALADGLIAALQQCIFSEEHIDLTKVALLQLPMDTFVDTIGEERDMFWYHMISMLAPMLFGLFMYILILFYGQNVSKEVAIEKTSKLMDTMLTSVHPVALVFGKVLGVFTAAIVQSFVWFVSIFVGLFGAAYSVQLLYPERQNTAILLVNMLRERFSASAFSLPALLLALIVFLAGVLAFFSLAGIAGSVVSKPEELSNANGIYIMPMMISWIVPYLATISEHESLLRICRMVPFTAPFCVPTDVLLGRMSLPLALVSTVLVLLLAFVLVFATGRIYKGLALYTGQSVTLKTIFGVLRGK